MLPSPLQRQDAVGLLRHVAAELAAFARKEFVRDLNQNARTIPGFRIAPAGATMRQIQKNLNSFADNFVAFIAADASYEPNATSIVLMRRIIESLGGRQAVLRVETRRHGLRLWAPFPFEGLVLERALLGHGGSHTSAQEHTFAVL